MSTQNEERADLAPHDAQPAQRHPAEERLDTAQTGTALPRSPEEIERLVQKLHRQTLELESRNEVLRRTHAELQASEERLLLAQEGTDAGVWEWNLQTGAIYVSPRLEQLYGLNVGTVQKYEDWGRHVHPDDIARTETERDSAIARRQPFHLEFRIVLGSGEIRWISARGRAFYDEAGAVVRLIGMNQDITERRLAEEALRNERANMQALIENADGSIWSVDANYCLIIGNSAFRQNLCKAFGHEFVAGDSLLSLELAPSVRDDWRSYYDRALRGEQFHVETQRKFGDTSRWMEYRFNPIRNSTGEITGVTVAGRDVTRRKRGEEQLRDQLAELTLYYDNAPVGLVVLDTDQRFVRVNKRLADINGVPPADHIGKTVEEVVPALAEQARQITAEILRTGNAVTAVELIGETAADPGVTHSWLEGWYPIRRADGEIIGFNIIVEDVTERKQAETALRASEARFRSQFQSTPIPTLIWRVANRQYTLIDFNIAAKRLSYNTVAGFLGMTAQQIYPDRPDLLERFQQCHEQQITITYESEYRSRSTGRTGVTIFTFAYVSPELVMLHLEDITEQRLNANALHRAIRKLDAHMDNSPVAVIEFNHEFRVIRWSREAARIFGWSHAEVMGKGIGELRWVHDDDITRVQQILGKMSSGEQPQISTINRNYRKDGAVILSEWYNSAQYDEAGRLQSVLSFVLDITQRRQAEDMLRQSQDNLARSQQIGRLGSWEWDVPNQTLFWSDELYRIFGVTREYILTYSGIEARIHPEDRALNTAKVQEALTALGPVDFELRIVRPDGEIRYIEQNIVVTHTANGQPSVLFGIMQDITQRKQAEHEREQLLAQLAQAQKMESVGRLAGGIAHGFNNLLAVIVMRTELAMNLTTPASPLYRNLSVIFNTAHRSADLVRQLLGFAGKQTIAPKALDLNTAVGSALPTLRKIVSEEIELVWQPGKELWTVKMDPAQIEQILANLCANARDAIKTAGAITLTTENVTLTQPITNRTTPIPPGDYVMLSVTDTGSGMDQALLPKIFEPFFTTKDVDKGTGLGLATVEGIVQQNRGHIAVASTLGAGTTFRIYLPRLAESVPAPAGEPLPALPQGHGETVLFVEDEEILLHMGIEALESLGYRVLASATPDVALQLAKEHAERLDLLITDIIMPKMNGQELAERVAALRPGIARLFVSGYPADYVAQRGVLSAEVHFLQKPFSLFGFATKVREALATK